MKTNIQISVNKSGAELGKSLGLSVSMGSYFGEYIINIETGESEVFIDFLKEMGATYNVKELVQS